MSQATMEKRDESVSAFSFGLISDYDGKERKTPHTTVGEHGKRNW
jgi:hypothetical protein